MSDYNEGDLVELVKGETVIRGRLNVPMVPNPEDGMFWVGDSTGLLGGFVTLGYTVTVIERAKPALPTEPGALIRIKRDFDPVGWVCERSTRGTWFSTDGHTYSHEALVALVAEYGPEYEVLEPVPVTAKKVLDDVRGHLTMPLDGRRPNGEFMIRAETLDIIAAEFGVQS